ncbi:von Willebrand factor A domain-containing protein 1 isoform X2 [Chiloscyllium punctatum]|uniref:von Willebrand factor A domain-containing protein 1 isoform X2 n=1 Tax=Chiloscyllium punctatum TaxID=137246 RepID=UPI003B63DFFC
MSRDRQNRGLQAAMLPLRGSSLQSLLLAAWIFLCTGAEYSVEDAEGDLLFLMDSSGSILPYEFTELKEFVVDLLKPFTIGPSDVQVSFMHISDDPVLEFPFNKYMSNTALQWGLLNMEQKLGDTNTGKAMTRAKDTMFTQKAGARPDVPKVLVWLTDGASSDDILEPIQLLKDLGATIFIVSTGRGNYMELKAAASDPSERRLYYVDPDDIYVITEELRNEILDENSPQRVVISESRPRSFRVSWAPTPPGVAAYEVLYGILPGGEPRLLNIDSSQNTTIVNNLEPNTTYLVTVSAVYHSGRKKALSAKACTQDVSFQVNHLKLTDISPTSVIASWDPAKGRVLNYRVRCTRHRRSPSVRNIPAQVRSVLLTDLIPGTDNRICVKAVYKNGTGQGLCRTVHTPQQQDSLSLGTESAKSFCTQEDPCW